MDSGCQGHVPKHDKEYPADEFGLGRCECCVLFGRKRDESSVPAFLKFAQSSVP